MTSEFVETRLLLPFAGGASRGIVLRPIVPVQNPTVNPAQCGDTDTVRIRTDYTRQGGNGSEPCSLRRKDAQRLAAENRPHRNAVGRRPILFSSLHASFLSCGLRQSQRKSSASTSAPRTIQSTLKRESPLSSLTNAPNAASSRILTNAALRAAISGRR